VTEAAGAVQSSLFPYDQWEPRLATLRDRYASATPHPHIVLDGLPRPRVKRRLGIDDRFVSGLLKRVGRRRAGD
jgi:hypothetical protein